MIVTIRRFTIFQTGKLLAVLYGCFSVVLLPFFLIGMAANPKGAAPMLIMLVVYPIMGFIGGIVGAAIYNLAARFVGGLEITLEGTEQQGSQPAGGAYVSPAAGDPSAHP